MCGTGKTVYAAVLTTTIGIERLKGTSGDWLNEIIDFGVSFVMVVRLVELGGLMSVAHPSFP